MIEIHAWRQIVLLISDTLSLLIVQKGSVVWLFVGLFVVIADDLSIVKESVVWAGCLFGQAQENGWAFLCDADYDQDGEHDDEDGAEGKTELTLVPANVLARLLGEQSKLLATAKPPTFLIVGIVKHTWLTLWR